MQALLRAFPCAVVLKEVAAGQTGIADKLYYSIFCAEMGKIRAGNGQFKLMFDFGDLKDIRKEPRRIGRKGAVF